MKKLTRAIHEYFTSEEGKAVLFEAVNTAFIREMIFEQARDENGNPIQPPKRKTESVNVIDQLVVYLAQTEGAMRGVQNDLNARENEIKALTSEFKEEQRRVIAAFQFIGQTLEKIAVSDETKEVKLIG